MKKASLLFTLLTLTTFAFSQEQTKPDFSKEIDTQLWKPFKEAYEARDAQKYNALHTNDILRITKNGIRQGKEFKDGVTKSYARKDLPKREITFKFEHRIHAEAVAYEIGYFKIKYQGEKMTYGRFSVLLKKENGKWKIAQDWDIDNINGTPITEEDYEKL